MLIISRVSSTNINTKCNKPKIKKERPAPLKSMSTFMPKQNTNSQSLVSFSPTMTSDG